MPESKSPVPAAAVDAPEAGAKAVKRALKKNVQPHEFGGPSKAKSGFFLFSDAERAGVIEKIKADCAQTGETFKVVLVGKTIGNKWKSLSDEEKKEWNAKGAEAKAEHKKADEEWKKTDQYKEYLKEVAKHKKKRADKKAKEEVDGAGMPKRPLNAYLFFNTEQWKSEQPGTIAYEFKAANPGMSMDKKARATAVKAKWDALGEEGQKKYQDMQKEAKEKYETELAAFKESDAYKKYAKTLAKNNKEKSSGDRLAKNAGADEEGSKKRGRKSASSKAGEASGSKRVKKEEGEEKVFDSEDDVEEEEEAEDEEGEAEEGEAEEEEGEEEAEE